MHFSTVAAFFMTVLVGQALAGKLTTDPRAVSLVIEC